MVKDETHVEIHLIFHPIWMRGERGGGGGGGGQKGEDNHKKKKKKNGQKNNLVGTLTFLGT
jgi:hypothetical protein